MNNIKYIKSNINGSFKEPIDTLIPNVAGNYFSSLLVNGKPSIFYVGNNNLLFTRNGNLECTEQWTEPITINEEQVSNNYCISSYIINKNPSIVYNITSDDLRY
jgi:hypothetical protein